MKDATAYADKYKLSVDQRQALIALDLPKMPAHYIAQANRERFGISGIAFDQSHHWMPEANNRRTPSGNIPG